MEMGLHPKCISEGAVGQEFVTKFGKVIQIVAMSPRKVRVLVLATEEEVDVAPNYPVFELEEKTAQEETECEEACVECDAPEEEPECESDETAQDEPQEVVASEQEEPQVESRDGPQDEPQESVEPAKMRVSLDNLSVQIVEKPKPKKPPVKAAAKKAAPKKKETKTKKEVTKPDATPKQGMTTKQLVTNMLMQGQQTRESLAQAIVDAKLSKNDSVKKVKSYVSIILHELKKTNKNFVSHGPGRYEIKK